MTPQDNELQLNLVVDATRTTMTALDLGANASEYGLNSAGSANVQLTTTLAFNFTFGLELQSNLVPADAFFIRSNSMTVTAMADIPSTTVNGETVPATISGQVAMATV